MPGCPGGLTSRYADTPDPFAPLVACHRLGFTVLDLRADAVVLAATPSFPLVTAPTRRSFLSAAKESIRASEWFWHRAPPAKFDP